MKRQEITVTIGQDGQATVTVSGIDGPACVAATEALEQALGAVRSRGRTPEYYRARQQQASAVRNVRVVRLDLTMTLKMYRLMASRLHLAETDGAV